VERGERGTRGQGGGGGRLSVCFMRKVDGARVTGTDGEGWRVMVFGRED
jgi:hypothetical protein